MSVNNLIDFSCIMFIDFIQNEVPWARGQVGISGGSWAGAGLELLLGLFPELLKPGATNLTSILHLCSCDSGSASRWVDRTVKVPAYRGAVKLKRSEVNMVDVMFSYFKYVLAWLEAHINRNKLILAHVSHSPSQISLKVVVRNEIFLICLSYITRPKYFFQSRLKT